MNEADLRKDTFGLAHKRVLCFAEWDVLTSGGEPRNRGGSRNVGGSGAGVGVGMLRGAGDSLTWK